MGVTVMAICRSIAERAIKIMTCQAHRVLLGENHSAVGNGAVLPVASRRNLGSGRSEMALGTFSIQIMTGGTFKGTRTVKICLFFVKPLLAFGMGVTVMAICRSIAVRAIKIMTAATGFVFRGQPRIIVRRFAMVPVNARGHLAAVGAKMTLDAFSIQIMTGAAIKRARTVKFSLVFVEPGLPQIMNVTVMAICRSIAVRAIKIMTTATGFVFRG